MNRTFYPKLAVTNIHKNGKNYFPYILTCIFTIAIYYIMKSLSLNKGFENTYGGSSVIYTLELGSYVVGIFAFIFLFYTNSFLMKNRKKEFGLYNILGMEKRHIAKVIGFESLYVTVISISLGLGVGILLDKLVYLVILRIINFDIELGFYISWRAMASTLIIFTVLFILIFLNSIRMIHISKPIELLNGGKTGEKEPKAKWLIALLGVVCLGIGYYMAITVENPIVALTLFFIAVILVIAGTYLLFTAGIIAFLKLLKKNKRYYYKTNHFISVSGMIYRMKQNAVGLANICILSTMVLVMVSSTASLMIGTEDIINERYPYQINIRSYDDGTYDHNEFSDIIQKTAKAENTSIKSEIDYASLNITVVYKGSDAFNTSTDYSMSELRNIFDMTFITAEDYQKLTGESAELEKDSDVYLWSPDIDYSRDYFILFDEKYNIIKHIDKINNNEKLLSNVYISGFCIVVKDMSVMQKLYKQQYEVFDKYASNIEHYYGLDIDGNEEKQKSLYEKLGTEVKNYAKGKVKGMGYTVEYRENRRYDIYSLYGSLFFLGAFLSIIFIMAAVLIIYYKQISEGYDDKKRFEIMQNVGMSEYEVKSSIRSQVLTIFFMPLIMTGIHTAFAFPIVKKVLALMQLSNVKLYAMCTIGSFIAFALIYTLIYMLTAKVYYKIVKK